MLKAGTKANAIVQKLRRTAGAIYARANKISSPSSTAWLTHAPDASFNELRGLYEADERLRVPAMVYNAVLQRTEPI
jgi:hypothetical protein